MIIFYMDETGNKIISISIKPDIVKILDEIIDELDLSGRSEAIRLGIKSLELEKNERNKLRGKIGAVLTVVHSHANNVSKISHKYQKIIISHLHNHFNNNSCVDIFVLNGEATIIRCLVEEVQRIKGVKKSKLIVIN